MTALYINLLNNRIFMLIPFLTEFKLNDFDVALTL